MKKLDRFFPIVVVFSLVVFFSTVAIPSQVVHALDPTLPVGVWKITVGKGNNVASKGNLAILGVGTQEILLEIMILNQFQEHTLSLLGNKIQWNVNTEPNIKYTGYLIFEPGCSQSPGGVWTYTLAGSKFIPGSTSGTLQSCHTQTDGMHKLQKVYRTNHQSEHKRRQSFQGHPEKSLIAK